MITVKIRPLQRVQQQRWSGIEREVMLDVVRMLWTCVILRNE